MHTQWISKRIHQFTLHFDNRDSWPNWLWIAHLNIITIRNAWDYQNNKDKWRNGHCK